LALSALLVLLPSAAPHAQSTQGGTSGLDPLELLRNMSPEQQQQILQQLGIGNIGGLGGARGTNRQRGGEDIEQNLRRPPTPEEEEEAASALPIFRASDSVVVEVELYRLPPRPTDTAAVLQALSSAGAAPGGVGGLSAQQQQQLQQYLLQQSQQQQPQLPFPSQVQGVPLQLSPQPQQQQGPPGQQQGQPAQPQGPPGQQVQGIEPEMTPLEFERLQKLRDLIRSKNPYQLSAEGVLNLPGFAGIPLAGLTEMQGTLRLEVEPALKGLYFRLTRLPLKKSGSAALKPFGYDLFDRYPSTFAPVTNIPVPSDYIVGPGDELEVQLYGNQNRTLSLIVGRDGRVNFPELGPISVSGQRFNAVKESLEERVARQMIGVKASVSMGDTRSIRVFVLGEAREPGSYTISGLGTITSALYASGGAKRIGSLRDIELKRQGALIRRLDLYDLLIRGDTTDDAKLLPGDVIFIPPIGQTVSVDGEVHRPAIYEIRHESTVGDLVQLAGGLTADAEPTSAMLTRVDEQEHRIVLQVNLTSAAGRAQPLRNGDLLNVSRLRPTLDAGVLLQGHVFNPQAVAYRPGMRLTDVVHSVDELRPNADLHYVLIRRELPPDRRIAAFSADLGAALALPGGPADVQLMPRDRVTVFDLESGRDRIIRPLLDELKLQSRLDRPTEVVRIGGRVKVPGEYPLEPGMKLSDLIRAGGSLSDAAYGGKAELTRYEIVNGEQRETQLIPVDLAAVLRGDPKADIQLTPFDSLSIKEVSQWGDQEEIELAGQVRFPGIYAIKHGETLKSVLARAGGPTDLAFTEGSVFTRDELRHREQDQLDLLAQRVQNDLATMALQGAAGGQASAGVALSVGQTLLTQIKSTRAVGRLVIDLPHLMRSPMGSQYDVVLRNRDRLNIPKFQQEVTVLGEVQSVTSHLYRSELNRDDYITLSGGMTKRADSSKIYVVRANGSVVSSESGRFFRTGSQATKIRPGDTIVVPLDTERIPGLIRWQAIATIVSSLAFGAAAIHSL
jgi:protein involved in polysaccharide export with SLBB domain